MSVYQEKVRRVKQMVKNRKTRVTDSYEYKSKYEPMGGNTK